MSTSIFWHDYETTGINPRCDRPLQVAGVRTDLDLNEIEAPVSPIRASTVPAVMPRNQCSWNRTVPNTGVAQGTGAGRSPLGAGNAKGCQRVADGANENQSRYC